MSDNNYKIFPVFNQGEYFWATMALLDEESLIHAGLAQPGRINNIKSIEDSRKIYNSGAFNFAFAAWNDMEMIGAIAGYVNGYGAIVENLIVRPEYRRRGVASSLLKATQAALPLNARRIILDDVATAGVVSFGASLGEVEFCKANGYKVLNEGSVYDDAYYKNINISTGYEIMPIFYANNDVAKQWRQMAPVGMNKNHLKDAVEYMKSKINVDKIPAFMTMYQGQVVAEIYYRAPESKGANPTAPITLTEQKLDMNRQVISKDLHSHLRTYLVHRHTLFEQLEKQR